MHELSQQPSPLKVTLAAEPPCLFVALRGELDVYTVRQVPWEEYSWRRDLKTVRLDLGELSFCDTTGLQALLRFRRIHELQGRSVVIFRATPPTWRLMRLCGITDRLESARPAELSV